MGWAGDRLAGLLVGRWTHHYTTVIYASDNGRSRAGRLGQRDTAGV